jgi:hypothetical protein
MHVRESNKFRIKAKDIPASCRFRASLDRRAIDLMRGISKKFMPCDAGTRLKTVHGQALAQPAVARKPWPSRFGQGRR